MAAPPVASLELAPEAGGNSKEAAITSRINATGEPKRRAVSATVTRRAAAKFLAGADYALESWLGGHGKPFFLCNQPSAFRLHTRPL